MRKFTTQARKRNQTTGLTWASPMTRWQWATVAAATVGMAATLIVADHVGASRVQDHLDRQATFPCNEDQVAIELWPGTPYITDGVHCLDIDDDPATLEIVRLIAD